MVSTDLILPFQIERGLFRGRLVRLGHLHENIHHAEAYTPLLSEYLSEFVALAAAFSDTLRFDGTFSLQLSGNGLVTFMIAELGSDGSVRACAHYNRSALEALEEEVPYAVLKSDLSHLFGQGYINFVVNQGMYADQYQGVIPLTPTTLETCLHDYFRPSRDFQAEIKIFSGAAAGECVVENGSVHQHAGSCVIMIQRIPGDPPLTYDSFLSDTLPYKEALLHQDEAWTHATQLLQNCTAQEALNWFVSPGDLLNRVFEQSGIYVYPVKKLIPKCRCSETRVRDLLRNFTEADLKSMVKENRIRVTCDFCRRQYTFPMQSFLS